MNATSTSRPKTPARPKTPSSKLASSADHHDDLDYQQTMHFGTASQLTGVTTPPTAKTIPTQTPSYSLASRTKESLRLARERQLQSAQKPSRPVKSVNPRSTLQNSATFTPSVPRSRVTTTSTFNPSRSRPITPVSTFRATTPTTPISPSRHSRQTSTVSVTSSPKTTPTAVRKTSAGSSTAVRDAIAKAKEAHKQKVQKNTPVRTKPVDYTDDTSFDEIDNPFNVTPGTPPLQAQLRRSIEIGRTSGNLNISNLELQEVPEDVYTMYDLSNKTVVVDFSSRSSGWYDSVDLERFNAAGNEISEIDERIVDEFGGIRHFDMHANKLSVLPPKFESFAFLRTVNLSNNALRNSALESITQIRTLIELYLANNQLDGPLTPNIASLKDLQILDLEGNTISTIPDTIGQLRRMRILLLGDNQLESLPWNSFEQLHDLYQLDLSSNKLEGDLLPANDEITLPSLSNLDLHSNSLSTLPSNLYLPSLTQFNATQNCLISTGTFFTTTPRAVHISLAQNQLSAIPDGIVHLAYLRSLDISNNIIEHIDPRLGLLDELTTFMWMGNLIRMRAWGSMDTEGIKGALRAKADEAVLKGIEEDLAMLKLNTCRGECAGTLDLTNKLEESGLTQEMVLQHVHATHFPVVSKAILQQNKLTVVPREISLVTTLTTLDLSRNYLGSKIFEQHVTLDNLINLDLSVNKFDSLDLLPTTFSAPSLKMLDVSFNSLTSLIPLHTHYPNLSTLHANSNQLETITPRDFEGLEVVQVNNNSINRLPPELALVTSLRVLGVDGNTFRVPGRRIVEAGSAALLEWLRGRCVEA